MVKVMEKLEFTFLTEKQVEKLDILIKYGTRAAITDFAILLGGFVASSCHTSEGNLRKDRTGWWWTKSFGGVTGARVVSLTGDSHWIDVNGRDGGARPALPYSLISQISTNGVSGAKGILEVEYGEYPQTVVSEDFSRTLERAYSNRTINQTNKKYTTDSVSYEDIDTPFKARTHIEYEYNGKKYIRFVADSNCEGEILSDGRKVKEGKPYWVEVEPIKWMIDKKTNIALSKKLIFSGVQFNNKRNYQGNFENTDIYRFLNDIFAKDIIPSVIDKTVGQSEPVVDNIYVDSIEASIKRQKAINEQIRVRIQKLEQLLQELNDIKKEETRLLAREAELKAQIEQKQVEIKGEKPYVK